MHQRICTSRYRRWWLWISSGCVGGYQNCHFCHSGGTFFSLTNLLYLTDTSKTLCGITRLNRYSSVDYSLLRFSFTLLRPFRVSYGLGLLVCPFSWCDQLIELANSGWRVLRRRYWRRVRVYSVLWWILSDGKLVKDWIISSGTPKKLVGNPLGTKTWSPKRELQL